MTGYFARNPTENGKKRTMPSEDTQFKPGHPGGPGRPKGSRSKLSEAFLKALADDFEANGVATIDQLRMESPKDYVGTIGRLMPKLMELSGPDGESIPISGAVKFVKSSDE